MPFAEKTTFVCVDFCTPKTSGKLHKNLVPMFASKEGTRAACYFILSEFSTTNHLYGSPIKSQALPLKRRHTLKSERAFSGMFWVNGGGHNERNCHYFVIESYSWQGGGVFCNLLTGMSESRSKWIPRLWKYGDYWQKEKASSPSHCILSQQWYVRRKDWAGRKCWNSTTNDKKRKKITWEIKLQNVVASQYNV